jgi:predicted transcriptional regulator
VATDDSGVVGVISAETLRQFQSDGKDDLPLGKLFDSTRFPHVHMDQSFDLALERMGAAGVDVLPVVSRFNVNQLIGIVRLADILRAYQIAPEPPQNQSAEATPQNKPRKANPQIEVASVFQPVDAI